ncbi:hypothetical protein JTB14_000592 [Gonioctena quinquepunctata]|nr:hypothetical protein JTB14_000592 [Gonioctena quinquepunctata]
MWATPPTPLDILLTHIDKEVMEVHSNEDLVQKDLLEHLVQTNVGREAGTHSQITLLRVAGHTGAEYNEQADQLATQGVKATYGDRY